MRWIMLAVVMTASCADTCQRIDKKDCFRLCTRQLDEAEALRACYDACKTLGDGEEGR